MKKLLSIFWRFLVLKLLEITGVVICFLIVWGLIELSLSIPDHISNYIGQILGVLVGIFVIICAVGANWGLAKKWAENKKEK